MKPHVICHMAASLDGRILPSRWRPSEAQVPGLYERLHDELGGDAWLVGRVTGQEFAKRGPYPSSSADHKYPREPWLTRRERTTYGIVLDAFGKIGWGRADIGGDPIVVVLTENVAESHLAGLRADGVSYLFAGEEEIDLALALDILNKELGIERLLLEGGGVVNGAFLRAGLVDEASLLIFPAVDGAKGAPSIFDSENDAAHLEAPIGSATLQSSQILEGGTVWLRYQFHGKSG